MMVSETLVGASDGEAMGGEGRRMKVEDAIAMVTFPFPHHSPGLAMAPPLLYAAQDRSQRATSLKVETFLSDFEERRR